MSLGCLMIDIAGTSLTDEDRTLLQHPLVGGVILFSRNYETPEQLQQLTTEIHALRQPPLLISVDHEGGRVQRFRKGFTALPSMESLGQLYDNDAKKACRYAEEIGWLLAVELRALGVDFSFTPVLDLELGISGVMKSRAFHAQPDVVAILARALIRGLHQAGMAEVGKHFPGHGSVSVDSHHSLPIDERSFADIELEDLIPFERLVNNGIAAIMPAHVVYPKVDSHPAGFSSYWLQTILRQQLRFTGVIFSDDISMGGATVAGDAVARTRSALKAGCDMVLICNDRPAVKSVIEAIKHYQAPASQARLIRLHGKNTYSWDTLKNDTRWIAAQNICASLIHDPELELGDDELH